MLHILSFSSHPVVTVRCHIHVSQQHTQCCYFEPVHALVGLWLINFEFGTYSTIDR